MTGVALCGETGAATPRVAGHDAVLSIVAAPDLDVVADDTLAQQAIEVTGTRRA